MSVSGNRRAATLLLVTACFFAQAAPLAAKSIPRPDHVVVVMEENHSYSEIIGNADAPYINSLAQSGALFTNSFGVEHPSQPNYLDLFSGSNQGVTDDSCPHTFSKIRNEESELRKGGFSFAGYSEGLPNRGSLVCAQGEYARKHVPWTNFSNDPGKFSFPFTRFPSDYAKLPTVSWVIPDLLDDMHDGTVAEADAWLENNLSGYVIWAQTHNSMLILTWDEDDGAHDNQIPTIFVGQMVKPGQYGEKITHYNVLRTIEAMYGLKPLGNSAGLKPLMDVWQ